MKPKPPTRLLLGALGAFVAAVALSARADDSLAALKALSEKPGLLLSTGADSATEHFGFGCQFVAQDRGATWAWDIWAVRDGKRVVILIRSGILEGHMYTRAVACDGVVVRLDPKRPGGLIATDKAWPSLNVQTKADEFYFNFELAKAPPADLLLDIGSVLRSALDKAREVKATPDRSGLIVRTDRGRLGVTPAPAGLDLPGPVAQIEMAKAEGNPLVVALFNRGSAEKVAGIRPLTLQVINRTGLPIREPAPGELSKLFAPVQDDPFADARNVVASNALSDLPRDNNYHFPAKAPAGEPKR